MGQQSACEQVWCRCSVVWVLETVAGWGQPHLCDHGWCTQGLRWELMLIWSYWRSRIGSARLLPPLGSCSWRRWQSSFSCMHVFNHLYCWYRFYWVLASLGLCLSLEISFKHRNVLRCINTKQAETKRRARSLALKQISCLSSAWPCWQDMLYFKGMKWLH